MFLLLCYDTRAAKGTQNLSQGGYVCIASVLCHEMVMELNQCGKSKALGFPSCHLQGDFKVHVNLQAVFHDREYFETPMCPEKT